MEFLVELILTIILEPILTILVEVPAELTANVIRKSRLPKWARVIFAVLIVIALVGSIGAIVCGAVLISTGETQSEKTWGTVILPIGLAVFVGYIIFAIVLYVKKDEYDMRFSASRVQAGLSTKSTTNVAIGQKIHVVIDRPLGSDHPVYDDVVYEVNYGFAPGYFADDGQYQDVYILGVDEPIEHFDGVLTAILRHNDERVDKWVVVPEWYTLNDEDIIEQTYFLERYFNSTLIR